MTTPEQERTVTDTTAPRMLKVKEPALPVVRHVPVAASTARSWRSVWFWGVAAILTAGLGVVIYLAPWVSGPIAVSVEVADPSPVTRVLAVNGRIAALHLVDVRAEVVGPLAAVLVAEGDTVRTGADLVRIDAGGQQAMLREAVAGLDAALVAQQQAVATYERLAALGANVARTVLDDAERAVQSAAQDVARMAALVDQAQVQLAKHTILAPLAGTVLALDIEPGQVIDPATILMTIADMTQLVVETDVDEAYATQISTGQTALLQLAGETVARAGHVDFVSQQVDAATGGLAVRLSFDAAVAAPVGMTVTANIVVDQRDAALTAPRAAIRSEDAETAVFVVQDGVASRRAVTVIDWPAARLIVTEGLAPGDRMIVDATGISDGQPVRVDTP